MESLSSARFDPRLVVKELVYRFLIMATADLQRGVFPSNELVGPFDEWSDPLDPVVQSLLRSKRPSDYVQVVNLLRYWSERSTAVGDATLAAFGLDGLGTLEISAAPRPQAKRKPRSTRGSEGSGVVQAGSGESALASQLPPSWSRVFDELTTWAGNQRDLGATATNDVKNLIHKSVIQSLDFSALPVSLGKSFKEQRRFDPQRHIYVAGSTTHQYQGDPIVVIEQDEGTATALQGLILLAELPDADDYQLADDYRRQAALFLEKWTLAVTARFEQSPEVSTIQAITGLLVCAAISGAFKEATDSHDYLAALFETGGSAVGEHRSREWHAVVQAADATHRRLRPVVEAHFGEARGTGGVRAIRADQILRVIQDFTDSWILESTDSAIDRFMRSVRPAVEAEWETLERLVTSIDGRVDPSRSWSEQMERVLELIEAAHMSGRLADVDAASDLRVLASSLDDNAPGRLLRIAEIVSAAPPFIEQLRAVASDLPDTLATIHSFITRAEQAMVGIAKDLDERHSGGFEDEAPDDVVLGVLGAVERLAEAVKRLEQ